MPATAPRQELWLDRDGALEQPPQLEAALAAARAATDVLVLCHGWNNDRVEARALYDALDGHLAAQWPALAAATGAAGERRFATVGVHWPSKRVRVDDGAPDGAPAGGARGARRAAADALEAALLELASFQDGEPTAAGGPAPTGGARRRRPRAAGAGARGSLEHAVGLIPQLAGDGAAAERAAAEFLATLVGLLPARAGEEGDRLLGPAVVASVVAPADGGAAARALLAQLGGEAGKAGEAGDGDEDGGAAPAAGRTEGRGGVSRPGRRPAARPAAGAPRGGAAGLGDRIGGVVGGALNLVNYVTYYQMKERAGIVGRNGVNELLRALARLPEGPRVHLVGHSFGARVVTAAATGARPAAAPLAATVSLLQAAFSHYAFAHRYDGTSDGFFRPLLTERRVAGPVLVTHTRNDRAVGIAYALASRVARQIARTVGGRGDRYGGLGGNGAQRTPEAVDARLRRAGDPYPAALAAGRVHNLHAGDGAAGLIRDHGDVGTAPVAWAIATAIAGSG